MGHLVQLCAAVLLDALELDAEPIVGAVGERELGGGLPDAGRARLRVGAGVGGRRLQRGLGRVGARLGFGFRRLGDLVLRRLDLAVGGALGRVVAIARRRTLLCVALTQRLQLRLAQALGVVLGLRVGLGHRGRVGIVADQLLALLQVVGLIVDIDGVALVRPRVGDTLVLAGLLQEGVVVGALPAAEDGRLAGARGRRVAGRTQDGGALGVVGGQRADSIAHRTGRRLELDQSGLLLAAQRAPVGLSPARSRRHHPVCRGAHR